MRTSTFAFAAIAALGLATCAQAHTVAIGTTNAGGPGSVTLWMGSYHTGAPAEGSMALIAGPVTTGPVAFTTTSNTLPVGLVAGVNYFYADNSSNPGGFNQTIQPSNQPAPTRWQGLTFSGLAPGTYTYQLTGMNTVNWSNWNTNTNNWTGTIVITGEVAGVPEPASLTMLGLGAIGLAGYAWRRRQKKAAASQQAV